ncbi:MAG: hypothetical protein ACKN87_10815, partial [Microcystis aeruginosa]
SNENGVLKSDRLLAMLTLMVVAFLTYSTGQLLKQIQELLDRRVGGLHTFLASQTTSLLSLYLAILV